MLKFDDIKENCNGELEILLFIFYFQSRACEHVKDSSQRNMFGSAQCLGYRMEHGQLSSDLCFPPESTVLKQIKRAVKRIKANSVFVATDNDAMIEKIQKALKKQKVKSFSPTRVLLYGLITTMIY